MICKRRRQIICDDSDLKLSLNDCLWRTNPCFAKEPKNNGSIAKFVSTAGALIVKTVWLQWIAFNIFRFEKYWWSRNWVYDFSWLATAGKTSLGKNESGSMVMIALIAGSKTTTRQKDNIGFPFSFPATQVGPKTSICKHPSLESTYNWIPTKDVCKKKKVGGGFHKSQSEPQMSSPLTRRHKNCDKSPKQIQRWLSNWMIRKR